MFDFDPATRTLTRLVGGVADARLEEPTPCSGTNLAALLDHVKGLAGAFADAARKTGGEVGPSADASRLGDDWRLRIAEGLEDLRAAWRDPAAWQGTTRIAGMEFPGEVVASIALNEVIVHGWDIAVSSGQSGEWPDELVDAAIAFVAPMAASSPEGMPGMFGPARPVHAGATPLQRLLCLTGRDPSWPPAGTGEPPAGTGEIAS